MSEYLRNLIQRQWRYKERQFRGRAELFKDNAESPQTPPVFLKEYRHYNVIAPGAQHQAVVGTLLPKDRHRHFGSMRSSQALTQSVFGTLKVLKKLHLLAGLEAEDGGLAFFKEAPAACETFLEFPCRSLGESQETKSDVFFRKPAPISVECKLSEDSLGSCSQPRLKPTDPNYERDICDGTYTFQARRTERCPLTAKGIQYWNRVPTFFRWSNAIDHQICPIRKPYQLVRNVLAADNGHALLVYDERNPEFGSEGECYKIWRDLRKNMQDSNKLRRCSWQRIVRALSRDQALSGFVEELKEKYGL